MKIRGLLAALLFIFTLAEGPKETSLDSVINELTPIARLINGIALEKELSTNPKKLLNIVSEFLGVKDVSNLKNLQLLGVSEDVQKFQTSLKSVPEVQVNGPELSNALEALKNIRAKAEVLKKAVKDISGQMKQDIEAAKKLNSSRFYEFPNFKTLANKLKYIRENEPKGNVLKDHLIPLKNATAVVFQQLQDLESYENELTSLYNLVAFAGHLPAIEGHAKASKDYIENYGTFTDNMKNMNNSLHLLQKSLASLKMISSPESKSRMEKLKESLESNSLKLEKSSKTLDVTASLTAGFPEGTKSLQTLFQDFKDQRFLKISHGKDLTDLQNLLKTLEAFKDQMTTFQVTWEGNIQEEGIGLVAYLDRTLDNVKNITDFSKLEGSLVPMQTCLKDLNLPNLKDTPDFKKVQEVIEKLKQISEKTNLFLKFLKGKKEMFQSQKNAVYNLNYQLVQKLNVSNITVQQQNVLYDSIRGKFSLEKTIKELFEIHEGFEHWKPNNPLVLINKESIDFSQLQAILKNPVGKEVSEMITCLDKNPFDLSKVEIAMDFGQSIWDLKKQDLVFNATIVYLEKAKHLQDGLEDFEKGMEGSRSNPGIRKLRKRRQTPKPPKSLTRLNKATEVSRSLGFGVQTLRDFQKILRHQEQVLIAANPFQSLKEVLDNMPEADIWIENKRRALRFMIQDLKNLQKNPFLKTNSSLELWWVFKVANQIPGVHMDAQLFDDPISQVLAQNPDPKIKEASATFKNLSTLNLDFGSHHVALQKASRTLHPIKTFFDSFFELQKEPEIDMGPEPVADAQVEITTRPVEPTNYTMILIYAAGGLGLILFIGMLVTGFLFLRHLRKQKRWKNRERHWIYEAFHLGHSAENNILKAIQSERPDHIKALIKEGAYVDLFGPYTNRTDQLIIATPLYQAVDKANAQCCEALILGGADPHIWSSEKITAAQLLERKLTDRNCKKHKEDLKEIKMIFDKYDLQEFPIGVRDLLPIDKFSIGILEGVFQKDPIVKEFKKVFKDMISENNKNVTHMVVPTDPQGVMDLDKLTLGLQDDVLNLGVIYWVLGSPSILVKQSWMNQCLKSKSNFYKDYTHRVQKIKYGEKVYNTLDEWKKWTRQFYIPCLENVELAYFVPEGSKFTENGYLKRIVEAMGATFMPISKLVNDSSKRPGKPHWLPKLSKFWILHRAEDEEKLEEELRMSHYSPEDQATEFSKMTVEVFFEMMFEARGVHGFNPTAKSIDITTEIQADYQVSTRSTHKSELQETQKSTTSSHASSKKISQAI